MLFTHTRSSYPDVWKTALSQVDWQMADGFGAYILHLCEMACGIYNGSFPLVGGGIV